MIALCAPKLCLKKLETLVSLQHMKTNTTLNPDSTGFVWLWVCIPVLVVNNSCIRNLIIVDVVKLTQCFNVKWAWVTTIGPGEPKNSVDLCIFFTQKTWCVCTYTIYIYTHRIYYDISCNVLYFIFCTMYIYIYITHVYEINMYVCMYVYIYIYHVFIYTYVTYHIYTMCVYIQYVIIMFGIVAMIILIILLMTTTRIM